jgi:hypothetical protein
VVGLPRQRDADHDHVRARQQSRQLLRLADLLDPRRRGRVAPARRHHFHAEAVRALGHLPADAAQADDQHRLVLERDRRGARALACPTPGRLRLELEAQVARQREQHREGVVGDGRAVHAAQVREHDRVLLGDRRLGDEPVDARAHLLHPDELRRAREELQRREARVDAADFRRERERLLGRRIGDHLQVRAIRRSSSIRSRVR